MQSWEETLQAVVRTYYRSGPAEPPEWVKERPPSAPEPVTISNATCGDRVVVHIDSPNRAPEEIGRIWLDVAGCAICKASAAMALRAAETLSWRELAGCAQEVSAWFTDAATGRFPDRAPGTSEPPEFPSEVLPPGDLAAMLRLRDVPGRSRCASLPWEAVAQAIAESR